MAILDIITVKDDTDDILRRTAEPCTMDWLAANQQLIDDMLETTLYIGALGLAAPQVGVSKQLFVLEDGTVCVNPSSIMGQGKISSRGEGCLSVPGRRFTVKRIRNVIVRCLDRLWQPQTLKPKRKIISIAIQHEIDHLNGILCCDKGAER